MKTKILTDIRMKSDQISLNKLRGQNNIIVFSKTCFSSHQDPNIFMIKLTTEDGGAQIDNNIIFSLFMIALKNEIPFVMKMRLGFCEDI